MDDQDSIFQIERKIRRKHNLSVSLQDFCINRFEVNGDIYYINTLYRRTTLNKPGAWFCDVFEHVHTKKIACEQCQMLKRIYAAQTELVKNNPCLFTSNVETKNLFWMQLCYSTLFGGYPLFRFKNVYCINDAYATK